MKAKLQPSPDLSAVCLSSRRVSLTCLHYHNCLAMGRFTQKQENKEEKLPTPTKTRHSSHTCPPPGRGQEQAACQA